MDYSPPGSSVHGILQDRYYTGMGCYSLLQGISPTQGSNLHLLHLLHWQADSLSLSYLGSQCYHDHILTVCVCMCVCVYNIPLTSLFFCWSHISSYCGLWYTLLFSVKNPLSTIFKMDLDFLFFHTHVNISSSKMQCLIMIMIPLQL